MYLQTSTTEKDGNKSMSIFSRKEQMKCCQSRERSNQFKPAGNMSRDQLRKPGETGYLSG